MSFLFLFGRCCRSGVDSDDEDDDDLIKDAKKQADGEIQNGTATPTVEALEAKDDNEPTVDGVKEYVGVDDTTDLLETKDRPLDDHEDLEGILQAKEVEVEPKEKIKHDVGSLVKKFESLTKDDDDLTTQADIKDLEEDVRDGTESLQQDGEKIIEEMNSVPGSSEVDAAIEQELDNLTKEKVDTVEGGLMSSILGDSDSNSSDAVENAKERLEDAKEKVEEIIEDVKEKVEEIVEDVKEKIEEVLEDVKENAEDLKDNIGTKLQDTGDVVEDKFEDVKDKFDDKIDDVTEAINDKFEDAQDSDHEKLSQSSDEDDKETDRKDKLSDEDENDSPGFFSRFASNFGDKVDELTKKVSGKDGAEEQVVREDAPTQQEVPHTLHTVDDNDDIGRTDGDRYDGASAKDDQDISDEEIARRMKLIADEESVLRERGEEAQSRLDKMARHIIRTSGEQ